MGGGRDEAFGVWSKGYGFFGGFSKFFCGFSGDDLGENQR